MSATMKHSGSIDSKDRLFFAGNIVFRPYPDGWLVVSIQSANWIVIRSAMQKELLERLIEGSTIGELMPMIQSESDLSQLKSLLSAIFARDFARTDAPPQTNYLEGYKMLNCYLTNACNLRCKHCFMRSGIPLKDELPASEWKRILEEFHNAGGVSVTFSGGEPLMNRDFDKILKFAHSIDLNTTVLTNGLLWTEERIQELSPTITEIQVSIDGVDESSNAKVRGKGHFDRIVSTVVGFANAGVRTSVATTFTFDNLQDDTAARYKSFVEAVKSKCTSPVFFKLSKKILAGRNTNYTQEENRTYYNRIVEIERSIDSGALFNNFIEGHSPNMVENNCGFGGISIGADGEVYFCNRISEVDSYGNIQGKPIAQFIKLGHELHLKTAVDNLTPCRECHLRYICDGGCRIDECNFKGRIKGFDGDLRQIACNEENRKRLEQKMIDSFNFFYTFK